MNNSILLYFCLKIKVYINCINFKNLLIYMC